MPKKGMPRSRAIRAARIMPRVPRIPKPPGTRMPSAPSSRCSPPSCSSASASTQWKRTRARFANPPWYSASLRLLYESVSSTYLPTT